MKAGEGFADSLRNAIGDISTASTLPPALLYRRGSAGGRGVGTAAAKLARDRQGRRVAQGGRLHGLRARGRVRHRAPRRRRGLARLRQHLPSSGHAPPRRARQCGRASAAPFTAGPTGWTEACAAPPEWQRQWGFAAPTWASSSSARQSAGGFAFVVLDDGAPAVDEWLGAFDDLHSPWRLGELATTRRRELEVDCNWKLFLEVFNESYHLEYVHAATFGGIYLEPELPDDAGGCVQSSFSPTAGTGGLKSDEQTHVLPAMPGLGARELSGTRYTWVFPSLTFAAGSEALWAYAARPLGPGRCHVTQWVCFPTETVATPGFEAKAERYYARMDEALAEDIAVLERQQLGMDSPFARAGRWSDLEHGAAAFAAWYAQRLSPAPSPARSSPLRRV